MKVRKLIQALLSKYQDIDDDVSIKLVSYYPNGREKDHVWVSLKGVDKVGHLVVDRANWDAAVARVSR